MKNNRIWFAGQGQSRRSRSKSSRPLRFLRYASLEGLELRAMLSGSSLLSDIAYYADNDAHATPVHELSLANMLASCLGNQNSSSNSALASSDDSDAQGDPPPAAPLAAASDENGDPPISPLVAGITTQVLLRLEDLNGNEITSLTAGQEFRLKVFVDDVRTSTTLKGPGGVDLFGVFGAYVRVTYDTDLVSVDNPSSLDIEDFFSLDARSSAEFAGIIRGGGSATSAANPGTAPQLLWTVTLQAKAAGTAVFNTFFETFPEDPTEAEWLMYGEPDTLTSDNVTLISTDLDIDGQPAVSIGDVTHAETDASQNYIFTVTLSDASSQQITVAFATNAGTADAGTDFVAQSGTLTFAAGVTQQLITISVLGDTDIEADETFTVVLSGPVNASLGDASGLGTIENDDTPIIGITGVTQLEGNETNQMVFTVTTSRASNEAVLVAFATQNGSATAGSDYTAISGTVTFAAGSTTSQFITVTINGDTTDEANEAFQLVLTEPSNAQFDESNGLATGNLLNDDGPHISFVDNSISQSEDQTEFVFTVSIGEAGAEPVTVEYTVAGGTATSGADFTAQTGTLTFSGATTTQLITVVVNNDTLNETDETFTVNLSNAVNATFVETSASGTIENDDPLPTLSFESDDVAETEGTAIVFTVNLSAASGQVVTVQYVTQNGTATAPGDYTGLTTQTLTFAPGETQQLITVVVTADTLNEPDETFQLQLSGGTNVSNTGELLATGTIENDDPLPSLTLTGPQSTNEGTAANPTQFVYTATLSAASGQTVTVAFATEDGTATSPGDYAAASGTLTFAPGETTKLITVSVVADSTRESSESFTINLSGAQNVTLTQEEFAATITNDDEVPTISIADAASQNEGNIGATPFFFTVTLSSPSDEAVTVVFTTQNGTASTSDDDYVATTGTLTFAPGQTTQVITVNVTGDAKNETDEAFAVNLSSPSGATLADGGANGNIVNDDPAPGISISDPTVNEGDSGTTSMVFTVTLSGTSVNSITVAFATQNGTATTANNDYTATSGTLTFAPGVTSQLITVSVIGDKFVEPNETLSVVLSSPQAGTITKGTGTGTITNESTDDINIVPSTISGKVFVDSNQNGVQNGLEQELAGVVRLSGTSTLGTAVNRPITIGADGTFTFTGVDPGTYTLTFIAAGASQFYPILGKHGSQGGTEAANVITFTINTPGGVTGTGNDFTTKGNLPQFLSLRPFIASELAKALAPPAQTVSVDAATVTNPINSVNATNTTISGTGTVGATISVVATDGATSTSALTTTVGSDGNWSISGINVNSLANGTITYNVTATGAGGGTATDSITSTKDTVAPALTIGTATDPINAANDDDASISGTGEVGATISVTVTDGTDTVAAKTTTVNGSGNWSIGGFNVTNLDDGTITFNVTATDTAGNTATSSKAVTKDTVAPTAAIGVVTPDPINADNEEDVTINGTGTVGASISVVVSDADSSTSPVTTTVAAGGTWSIGDIDVSSLDDGTLTFTVIATDTAGNTTTVTKTAIKDTVTQVAIGDVTEPINADDADAVTITGTGEVGASISVVAGDGEDTTGPQTATVNAEGNWTVTIDVSELADGTITFTATATDTAGNDATDTETAVKDTVTTVAITGLSDPINLANVDSTSISGTGEAGASISVAVSNGATNLPGPFVTTVAANGTWSIDNIDVRTLADGTITYAVTTTDEAGNTNTASDTAAKATLAIATVTDPINLANQAAVVISGTGQVGATISVVADDGTNDTDPETTTVAGDGTWTVTIDVTELDDGTTTFTVTATDGDANSLEKTIDAEKDTIAPALAITNATDPITAANQAAVTVSGTGEVGAGISVVAGDGDTLTSPQTTTVAGNGTWTVTIDVSSLNDGPITFTATATDGAGNPSTDTDSADKDTITAVAISEFTGPINIANVDEVAVSGTGEVGATVSLMVSDGTNTLVPLSMTVGAGGTWTFADIDTSTLNDGTITYTVTITDLVGNTNSDSETADKATLVIASVTDPINAANATSVTISGTGQVGALISVVADDGVDETSPATTTVDGDGNWSVTMAVNMLDDGELTFTVTAKDVDDNSVQFAITAEKDTLAPEFAIVSVTDPINAEDAAAVSISGTGEVGATIAVVVHDGVDETPVQMVTVDGAGNWALTINVSALADGTLTFMVTASDAAGNEANLEDTAEKDTQVAVTIGDVTDPVNADNQATTEISGTGEIGATVVVVVTNGVDTTGTFSTTVDGIGNWSIANVDVSPLPDGTLTYTVTITDALDNANETSITTTKDTVLPALAIGTVTDPIDSDNSDAVSINGTGEIGATIKVEGTDGVASTIAYMTTVDGDGNWSIVDMDVSMLADGTITFTATATDANGNEAEDQITADKTSAAPLMMTAQDDGEDDDESLDAVAAAVTAEEADDSDATDEALAGEDDWLFT